MSFDNEPRMIDGLAPENGGAGGQGEISGDRVQSPNLPPADSPSWSGWDVLIIAFAFFWSDLLATAAAGMYAFYMFHENLERLPSDVRVVVAGQLAAYAVAFFAMYLIVTRRHHRRFWSGISWIWPSRSRITLGLVALGMLLAMGISVLEARLPMPSHVPFENLFRTPMSAYIMAGLAILAAPFMEELFFRGFLYPALRRAGAPISILLTSVAFAFVHGAQYGWAWSAVLLMFIVGLALTITRARSGSVAYGFVTHAAYNCTLFVFMYFSTEHFHHLVA